jgi:hypothetical protein
MDKMRGTSYKNTLIRVKRLSPRYLSNKKIACYQVKLLVPPAGHYLNHIIAAYKQLEKLIG